MKSESLLDTTQTAMDSCQNPTTQVSTAMDGICQMNGNSSAQSLDSYQTIHATIESEPSLAKITPTMESHPDHNDEPHDDRHKRFGVCRTTNSDRSHRRLSGVRARPRVGEPAVVSASLVSIATSVSGVSGEHSITHHRNQ